MPFYVPVGPRGLIFRLGCFLYGIVGGVTYWRATRRRQFATVTLPTSFDYQDA
jgi:hypothetical protein